MSTHVFLSIKQSSKDIKLLWFSVFVRMLSFGFTNQVLILYLEELGITESQIGIFISLTMIGDSILSYFLTWNSLKFGNRNIMWSGALLMFAAGSVFASGTTNFTYLLLAAVFGVISPSGNDTGPFKTIEETVLAHLTPPNHRAEIYAVHWVLGSVGSSLGSLIAGLFIQYSVFNLGNSYKQAYQRSFYIFCLVSAIKFILMLFLSHKTEHSYIPPYQRQLQQHQDQQRQQEPAIFYGSIDDDNDPRFESIRQSASRSSLAVQSTVEHQTWTGLSPHTQSILFQLLVPFMMDSFGYGFMPGAWVVYYFKTYLGASSVLLGILFSSSDIAMSISAIPSAWFAKRFGPIKSSVFTQIPCGIFFACVPIFGSSIPVAAAFYLLNQVTTAFDVVPRQIILTSIVKPEELAKVMGSVNIGKQIARSISPYLTGVLAEHGYLWICFLISASFLILANVILAIRFRGLDEKVRKMESVNHEIA
ncbi:hypothetical protein DAMA08_035820 [Martiniozyma asiatica (nom. inval.)]|nr:hypothetical protein DAMA08_035820 [Martiniozyma asiatica]